MGKKTKEELVEYIKGIRDSYSEDDTLRKIYEKIELNTLNDYEKIVKQLDERGSGIFYYFVAGSDESGMATLTVKQINILKEDDMYIGNFND